MTETILGGLFMVVGLAAWWGVARRTGDLIHPLGIMSMFWFVVFGFGHWNVAATYDEPYYALPFELRTYVVVIAAAAVFAFGYWLIDPEMPNPDREAIARRLKGSIEVAPLRALTLVFFALATLTTVYFVSLLGGEIPLFSPRVDELRQVWKRPLVGYVYDLHYVVALFGTILADRARTKRERVGWVLLVLASITQLAFGAVRVSPLTGIVWAAVYIFYRGAGRIRLQHLALLALVIFGLSSMIEYYRRTPIRLNPSLANPRLDLSLGATVWGHTGASFKNLQLSLEKHVPFLGMGATSFDIAKTLDPGLRRRDEEISYRYGVHNTTTYLVPLYMDFGLFGLFVMPGVYGALTAYVYRRFRERSGIFWLIVYIDFLLAVVLAFRTHKFLGNTLLYFGAVALLAQLVAGRDPDRAEAHDGSDADEGYDPGPWSGPALPEGVRTA
jgi:oligosaccharide repeat unit polymerase